ncbi:actin-2-like [Patagioenas fasciata monilis]|uniref:Actin-2-like n=1 Tax=Patagioenas fasciata monilis TaxID=372326 RepID=A0A1V4K8Y9_PATFA|nr:actin-2-like [Patagioenas fasciata monilis]
MGAKVVERYKALCTVVIDMGTGHTRSRLAGDKQLWLVVPCQAVDSPIFTHGMVTAWNKLEELWYHVLYQELGACPEEVAVLATNAQLSPMPTKEKVTKLLLQRVSHAGAGPLLARS